MERGLKSSAPRWRSRGEGRGKRAGTVPRASADFGVRIEPHGDRPPALRGIRRDEAPLGAHDPHVGVAEHLEALLDHHRRHERDAVGIERPPALHRHNVNGRVLRARRGRHEA